MMYAELQRLDERSATELRPELTDGDWIESGGELISASGASCAVHGAGLGRNDVAWEHEAPWVRAKRAVGRAFARLGPGVRVAVGDVDAHERGLSRRGFAVEVAIDPDPGGLADTYIALVMHGEADVDYVERVHREARVLAWLGSRIRGVRVPRVVALVGDRPAPILVESFVPGLVVDLRVGKFLSEPWETVARVAAAIHRIEAPPAHVAPPRSRSRHRAELLEELFPDGEEEPGPLADAYAWMRERVDRPGAGVLLHGDLLGHNLRLFPGDETGVIDWEHTEIGDPAHELAIVTRGRRRPHQWPDGRARLLAAYQREGGIEVTVDDLRFFELALNVRWVQQDPPGAREYRYAVARLLRSAA